MLFTATQLNTQEGNINSSSHPWHAAKEWSAFESGNKEDRGGKAEGRRDAGYERQGQLELKQLHKLLPTLENEILVSGLLKTPNDMGITCTWGNDHGHEVSTSYIPTSNRTVWDLNYIGKSTLHNSTRIKGTCKKLDGFLVWSSSRTNSGQRFHFSAQSKWQHFLTAFFWPTACAPGSDSTRCLQTVPGTRMQKSSSTCSCADPGPC